MIVEILIFRYKGTRTLCHRTIAVIVKCQWVIMCPAFRVVPIPVISGAYPGINTELAVCHCPQKTACGVGQWFSKWGPGTLGILTGGPQQNVLI